MNPPLKFPLPRPLGKASSVYIDTDNEQIKQMYEAGYSLRQIAEKSGVSKPTIIKRLRAMGVPIRPRGGVPFKRGSDLRNPSQMRTRNITGPGNVGGAHQQFSGAPTAGSKNIPRT
jgi:predicted DNA-binding transcriptional regulator AlpA